MRLNFNQTWALIDFFRTERIREASRLSNDRSDWLEVLSANYYAQNTHIIKNAQSSAQRNENLTHGFLLHMWYGQAPSMEAFSPIHFTYQLRRFLWCSTAHESLLTGWPPCVLSAKSGKQLICAVLMARVSDFSSETNPQQHRTPPGDEAKPTQKLP